MMDLENSQGTHIIRQVIQLENLSDVGVACKLVQKQVELSRSGNRAFFLF
jgi:hypothetical protein